MLLIGWSHRMLMLYTTKLKATIWQSCMAALTVSSACRVITRFCVARCRSRSRPLTLSGMRSLWWWPQTGMWASLHNKSKASRWWQAKLIIVQFRSKSLIFLMLWRGWERTWKVGSRVEGVEPTSRHVGFYSFMQANVVISCLCLNDILKANRQKCQLLNQCCTNRQKCQLLNQCCTKG